MSLNNPGVYFRNTSLGYTLACGCLRTLLVKRHAGKGSEVLKIQEIRVQCEPHMCDCMPAWGSGEQNGPWFIKQPQFLWSLFRSH